MKMERKYFFKTLLMTIIIGLLIVSLWFYFLIKFFPVANNSYTLAHKDKIEKLREEHSRNKIVFFGGSNIAFGLNSKFIEENIKKYKVLNLGTHASLGSRIPLNEIEKYLRNGDILIISLEYEQFFSGGYGGVSIWELIAEKREIPNLKLKEFLKIAFSSLEILKVQLNARISEKMYGKIFTYDRRGFNEKGDYIEHNKYRSTKKIRQENLKIEKNIDNDFIEWLKIFGEKAKKRGIKVYFIPPAIEENTGLKNLKVIEEIESKMRESNFSYIGKAEDFFFKDEYMYDSIYHLNKVGQKIRSEKILKLLQKN